MKAVPIPLACGRFVTVDRDVAGRVAQFKWSAKKRKTGGFYAQTSSRRPDGRRTSITLHRFLWDLWGLPATPEIDHVNRDGLDCRRENLRAATSSQNKQNVSKRSTNTSGFKGVYWHRRLGKWFAQITCDGKQRHLGCFTEKEEAARAYARAAVELFGEFARTA